MMNKKLIQKRLKNIEHSAYWMNQYIDNWTEKRFSQELSKIEKQLNRIKAVSNRPDQLKTK